jgi:hypothetical protein
MEIRKEFCYLSQMLIIIRWIIKVVEVNQEDRRIDDVISQAEEIIDNQDEFILSSLENKIKLLLSSNLNK